jgi:hypothetical protein
LNAQKPFISQRKAIEMFNYDDDDAQVQEEYERILKDMESTSEPSFNDSDYFGQGAMSDEDSEQTAELTSDSDRGSGNTNSFNSQE